jgi:hypothetical protein
MVSVVTVHLNSVMASAVLMALAKHTCVCVCVCVCVCGLALAWTSNTCDIFLV